MLKLRKKSILCVNGNDTLHTHAEHKVKNLKKFRVCTMFNKKRTLRKAKKHDPGSKRYNLHKQAKATLGGGNARLAVKKPDDETLEDWLAMNSVFDR